MGGMYAVSLLTAFATSDIADGLEAVELVVAARGTADGCDAVTAGDAGTDAVAAGGAAGAVAAGCVLGGVLYPPPAHHAGGVKVEGLPDVAPPLPAVDPPPPEPLPVPSAACCACSAAASSWP